MNVNWTRADYVATLQRLSQHVNQLSQCTARLNYLTRQRDEVSEYNKLVPGSRKKAEDRVAAVNAEIQHTRQIEQGAIAEFRQFYFGIGGPEFYPVDYLNGYAITQVATLIAQHRADSVGEALRFLLQQEEAQGQYRQAQAAADRRHRQNLQHRQDVANRAILWDMWRDWR